MSLGQVVIAISNELNVRLALAGWPTLTSMLNGSPGRIVVGDRHQHDMLVPPRVIFLPTTTNFSAPDPSRGPVRLADNADGPDAESRAAIGARSIWTDAATFEVSCWSLAPDGLLDSDASDFDYTRGLYHCLLGAVHALTAGVYHLGRGSWRGTNHLQRVGREFVFTLTIDTPILSEPFPGPGLSPTGPGGSPAPGGYIGIDGPLPGQVPIGGDGLPYPVGLPTAPSDVKQGTTVELDDASTEKTTIDGG